MATMARRRTAAGLVGLIVACATGGRAADPPPKVSTGGIHLGGPVCGPDIDAKALEGRVVLLELWGMQCEPCATTMPRLEALHRRLGPQGLVVVGAHLSEGSADDVRRAAGALGVTFSIVGQSGIEGLDRVPQMPYTLLFDHTGKCVFAGSALEVDGAAAAAAVNASPPRVLNGRPLEKLASLQPLLRNEATYGTALKKARSMASSKDAETAEEAAFVVEKLEAWGRDVIEKAPELRAADPARAFAALQQCAATFKGDDIGGNATRLAVEWKKDPAFQAALKCGQQLAQLEGLRGTATGGAKVVTPDLAAAVPQAVRKQMKDLADKVQKAAPGTKLAERAAEIATEFGLHDGGR
ncbi:MAG: TlpA disulfide reductase family protein [Planctomycetaceae bacterium]